MELRPYIRPNYFEVAGNYQQADLSLQSPLSEQLISHESAITTIKLNIDTNLAKASIFDENVLTALGKKTNCRIEWRNDALMVWSDAKEDLQAAVTNISALQSNKVYCHLCVLKSLVNANALDWLYLSPPNLRLLLISSASWAQIPLLLQHQCC